MTPRALRALRALTTRGKGQIQNVYMIWIPLNVIDNLYKFQSLLTFQKAFSARQGSKSARAAMGNVMQIWSKTCYFKNRNSSSDSPSTPNFYIMVGKSMSWRYDFIPPWLVQSETKSSYWHLNSNKCILLMTSFLSLFNWDYLTYRRSIFSQILICCSWDNFLSEIWHLFFI